MRQTPDWTLVACVGLALGMSALVDVSGATLEVDADGGTSYSEIQSAIDDAVPLVDDVLVHCGIYQENVQMRSGVSLAGSGAGCTVIDGGESGSTVTLIGTGPDTVLRDFTITHGSSGLGGGVYIENGSPTITRNLIQGNRAVGIGGLTGYGGGIHITSPVAFRGSTAPVITHNIIRGNSADKFGGGIEVYADSGAVISNNRIEQNTAIEGGGGIDLFTAFPTVANNTIVFNCADGGCAQGGGGIAMTNSGISNIANNVIAWNEAAAGGAGVDLVNSTALFNSNDVFGNLAAGLPGDYSGVSDPTGSAGNISVDPLFVEGSEGWSAYQPRSDSPLVEGGALLFGSSEDLRGLTRPLDGDADGMALPDIGSRENEGVTRLRIDAAAVVGWDASGDATAGFNLYRGDLEVLLAGGDYTQDPAVVADAERWCGLGSAFRVDADAPDPGQGFFYLVALSNDIEGGLGFGSDGSERLFTPGNRCP